MTICTIALRSTCRSTTRDGRSPFARVDHEGIGQRIVREARHQIAQSAARLDVGKRLLARNEAEFLHLPVLLEAALDLRDVGAIGIESCDAARCRQRVIVVFLIDGLACLLRQLGGIRLTHTLDHRRFAIGAPLRQHLQLLPRFRPVLLVDGVHRRVVRRLRFGLEIRLLDDGTRGAVGGLALEYLLTELLGFDGVKNYDGSWTEYGSLVGAPVEKG